MRLLHSCAYSVSGDRLDFDIPETAEVYGMFLISCKMQQYIYMLSDNQ
jgi:hypothetical protein